MVQLAIRTTPALSFQHQTRLKAKQPTQVSRNSLFHEHSLTKQSKSKKLALLGKQMVMTLLVVAQMKATLIHTGLFQEEAQLMMYPQLIQLVI